MTFSILVLFLVPLLSGLLVYLVPGARTSNYRLFLVFAGSYLFSITVIHILPEIYAHGAEAGMIGLFVLAGFFLQQFLEYFSSGIEHGHIHSHHGDGHHHSHHHQSVSALVLLFALCVHAFLEGGILVTPPEGGHGHDQDALLLGIVLHRAPAAFALMTVLAVQLHKTSRALPYLVVFSLASPAGLLVSSYLAGEELVSAAFLLYLYALVSGNFLHISTTIVFESSPNHRFNGRKLATSVLGALVAVAVEYML